MAFHLTLSPATDSRRRMLGLFALCMSLLMVLVVTEQARTIESQRDLIQLLSADSEQWQAARARQVMEHNAQRRDQKNEAADHAGKDMPLEQYRVDPDPLPPPANKKPMVSGVRVLRWT